MLAEALGPGMFNSKHLRSLEKTPVGEPVPQGNNVSAQMRPPLQMPSSTSNNLDDDQEAWIELLSGVGED